jgi:hypothetical protein
LERGETSTSVEDSPSEHGPPGFREADARAGGEVAALAGGEVAALAER